MPKEDQFVNRAQLLKAIKKYPEIWDTNNKLHMCRSVTAPMWHEIAEQFGGHVPTVKLQSIWSQMKYHYHNLVHRQILHKERFTTKWEHFEPMSFMYNITVAKIIGAASVDPSQLNPQAPAPSPTPPPPLAMSLTLPPQPLPPSHPLTSQGRGRPSGSFTWLPGAGQQAAAVAQAPTLPSPTIPALSVIDAPPPPPGIGFTGFTGLVPPAAITVETITTTSPPPPPPPPPPPMLAVALRKPGRPGSVSNSMRGLIIDTIRAHPVLWAGRQREQRQGQNRTSAVWKEVAAELGLTPSLVQTRWSIIKQRYVDELQKERHALYSQQAFRSAWDHFERMSFMREILAKKVDEREQTREHIQEIVSEQQLLTQQQEHTQHMHHHQQQQQHQHQLHTHAHPHQHQHQHHNHQHHLHQQQQQQHQQHQQQQHLRYMRPAGSMAAMSGGGGGSVITGSASASLQLAAEPVCADDGSYVDVVGGILPVHHHVSGSGGGRRRVKTESDLEWDPFEMILHVQSADCAPGN